MKAIINEFSTRLAGIVSLKHPDGETADYPYATYEYNTITFNNQYQILFSLNIYTESATTAEDIATQARKALHDVNVATDEVGFRVTHSPEPLTLPTEGIGKHGRRLNFTIIAYFKED